MIASAKTCQIQDHALRDLIDLSINETLSRPRHPRRRCSWPHAAGVVRRSTLSGFPWVMLFGIVVGILVFDFHCGSILLFLGEIPGAAAAQATPATVTGRPRRRPPDAQPRHRRRHCSQSAPPASPSGSPRREELVLIVGARAGTAADRAAPCARSVPRAHLRGTASTCSIITATAAWRHSAPSPTHPLRPDPRLVATPSLPARTVDCSDAATLLDRLRLLAPSAKEPIAWFPPPTVRWSPSRHHRRSGEKRRCGAARHTA